MTSVSARSAGVAVALYFGYGVVAGAARELAQMGILLAQQPVDPPTVALSWANVFLAPFPYVVTGFAVLWLWPASRSQNPLLALIGRAAVAALAGAILSWIIDFAAASRVSGGWFTSMPREYSFPEWYFGQAASVLVGGIAQNFPAIALAAVVTAFLLRRVLPYGHSETLGVTKRE